MKSSSLSNLFEEMWRDDRSPFFTSSVLTGLNYKTHRDRTRASTLCCFWLFFSSFEHVKSLLIMGPNNTKNSSLKCDFLITMKIIIRILF
jgi:hypothetical protein